ncbi:MAG: hypothetical protein JNM56_32555 [Planctomycetia bacterium]|nr:hypothetical protein [Planctomycetia bacterium]
MPTFHGPPGHIHSPDTNSPGTGDPLLSEAIALQESLRQALGHVNQVVALLKQEKRQRRALHSALGSLQRLQPWPRSA